MDRPTLWIDVEDIFLYAQANPRPSGIQRVCFELCKALREAGAPVRFVRHHGNDGFAEVTWADLAGLFGRLTDTHRPGGSPLAQPAEAGPHGKISRALRGLVHPLPFALRRSLGELMRAQAAALRAWVKAAREARRAVAQALNPPPGPPTGDTGHFRAEVRAGDWLVTLGAPWDHPAYGEKISAARARHGLRFALLSYDLFPIRFAEYCNAGLVRLFTAWCDDVLPRANAIFAISNSTATDVEARLSELGVTDPPAVWVLPMGTGFGGGPAASQRTPRLPPAGTYALIVSTIEARKNHQMAFRAWRQLLRERPADQVPTLVFAGRVGWMVEDLLQQIRNTHALGGKLLIVSDPTDGEVSALYEGCLFTMMPSFAEGWGLPVSESHGFGKPCFAANRTALPESGAGLARLFDPDNLNDLLAELRQLLDDPTDLPAWTEKVRNNFVPTPWSAAADVLIGHLHSDSVGTTIRNLE